MAGVDTLFYEIFDFDVRKLKDMLELNVAFRDQNLKVSESHLLFLPIDKNVSVWNVEMLQLTSNLGYFWKIRRIERN